MHRISQMTDPVAEWLSRSKWLVILNAVIALATVIAFIYQGGKYFFGAKDERMLTYHVRRPQEIRLKRTSGLACTWTGGPGTYRVISADVTATRITVWNNGKKPIHAPHVKKPIMIVASPSRAILGVRIRDHYGKGGTGFSFDDANFQDGQIRLTWEVLDYQDGADLEILYEGKPNDVNFSVVGAILEQARIHPSRTSY